MTVTDVGGLCFGIVIGWVTSRTLRRSTPTALSDIATVIGAVGGAAITALFKVGSDAFGYYCIGLLAGFVVYLIAAISAARREGAPINDWLGSERGGAPNPTQLPFNPPG